MSNYTGSELALVPLALPVANLVVRGLAGNGPNAPGMSFHRISLILLIVATCVVSLYFSWQATKKITDTWVFITTNLVKCFLGLMLCVQFGIGVRGPPTKMSRITFLTMAVIGATIIAYMVEPERSACVRGPGGNMASIDTSRGAQNMDRLTLHAEYLAMQDTCSIQRRCFNVTAQTLNYDCISFRALQCVNTLTAILRRDIVDALCKPNLKFCDIVKLHNFTQNMEECYQEGAQDRDVFYYGLLFVMTTTAALMFVEADHGGDAVLVQQFYERISPGIGLAIFALGRAAVYLCVRIWAQGCEFCRATWLIVRAWPWTNWFTLLWQAVGRALIWLLGALLTMYRHAPAQHAPAEDNAAVDNAVVYNPAVAVPAVHVKMEPVPAPLRRSRRSTQ
jgi:hypothetical protein